jgi:hypothetical protein
MPTARVPATPDRQGAETPGRRRIFPSRPRSSCAPTFLPSFPTALLLFPHVDRQIPSILAAPQLLLRMPYLSTSTLHPPPHHPLSEEREGQERREVLVSDLLIVRFGGLPSSDPPPPPPFLRPQPQGKFHPPPSSDSTPPEPYRQAPHPNPTQRHRMHRTAPHRRSLRFRRPENIASAAPICPSEIPHLRSTSAGRRETKTPRFAVVRSLSTPFPTKNVQTEAQCKLTCKVVSFVACQAQSN